MCVGSTPNSSPFCTLLHISVSSPKTVDSKRADRYLTFYLRGRPPPPPPPPPGTVFNLSGDLSGGFGSTLSVRMRRLKEQLEGKLPPISLAGGTSGSASFRGLAVVFAMQKLMRFQFSISLCRRGEEANI